MRSPQWAHKASKGPGNTPSHSVYPLADVTPKMPLFIFILYWFKLDIKEFIIDSNHIHITRVEKSFSQKSGLNYGNHTGVKYYECNIFWSMGKRLISVHILHDIREFMLEKERRNVLHVVNLSAADQIFHLQTTHTRLHMRGHNKCGTWGFGGNGRFPMWIRYP